MNLNRLAFLAAAALMGVAAPSISIAQDAAARNLILRSGNTTAANVGTLSVTTLTAPRSYTFPDKDGAVLVTPAAMSPLSVLRTNALGDIETVALTDGQLLIGGTGGLPTAATLTGTTNQVTVTNGTNSITLSLPQDIHTGASPTFYGLTITDGPISLTTTGANDITITPAGELKLVGITSLSPITDLLWIDASNNVRRAPFTGTANEGVEFQSSAYRLGGQTATTNPLTSNRYVNIDDNTLTFTAAAGAQSPLVLTSDGTNTSATITAYGTGTFQLTTPSGLNIATDGKISDAGGDVEVNDNLNVAGTVTINDAGGNDLTLSETTISRSGNIAINPGTGNDITTDGGITSAENVTITAGGLTVTAGGANITGATTIATGVNELTVTGLAADNTLTSMLTLNGSDQVRTTALNDVAWLVGGNTLSGAASIGSNSAHNVEIKANGTTRLTIESGSATVTAAADLVPSADATYDLGTDAVRWANAYIDGASLHIGPSGGMAGGTELAIGYVGSNATINVDGGTTELTVAAGSATVGGTLTINSAGGANLTIDENTISRSGNIFINPGSGNTLSTDGSLNVLVSLDVTSNTMLNGSLTAGNGNDNVSINAGTGTFQLVSTGLNVNTSGDISNTAAAVVVDDAQGLNVKQGGVDIDAGGLNVDAGGATVVGTTSINTTAAANTTTIGNNTAGNTVTVNSPSVTLANLPAGTGDVFVMSNAGALETRTISNIVTGTGTNGRLTRWGASNTLQDASLDDDGSGVLSRTGNIQLNPGSGNTVSTDGSLGIGTATAIAPLHVSRSAAAGTMDVLLMNSAAAGTLNNAVQITFANDNGATPAVPNAFIRSENTGGANNAATLSFGTWDGAASATRMSIAPNGDVTIAGTVTINNAGGNDLTLAETTISRSGNIAINPGSGNDITTDGGITSAENVTITAGGLTVTAGGAGITGTTSINTTAAANTTTIGNNTAGNTVTVNSPSVTLANLPAGTGDVFVMSNAGALETRTISNIVTGTGTNGRLTRWGASNTLQDASLDDDGSGVLSRTGNIQLNPGSGNTLSTDGSLTVAVTTTLNGAVNAGNGDDNVNINAGTGTFQLSSTGLNVNTSGDISSAAGAVVVDDANGLNVKQGGVDIDAGGLNVDAGGATIVGTTSINTTAAANTTTIGNNTAGNTLAVNAPVVTMANLPAAAATANVFIVEEAGEIRKRTITGSVLSGTGTDGRMTRWGAGNTLQDASLDDNGSGVLSRTGNIQLNPGSGNTVSTDGSLTVAVTTTLNGAVNAGNGDDNVNINAGTGTFQLSSTGLNVNTSGDISSAAGAVVVDDAQGLNVKQGGVDIDAGGLNVDAGGATIVGTTSINNNANNNTDINTGTSTGAVTIGGGSGTVAIASTGLNVTTAGVISDAGGNVEVADHLVPSADATYDLGTDAVRWANAYIDGASLHIGPAGSAGGNELVVGYAASTANLNANAGTTELALGTDAVTMIGATNINNNANYAVNINTGTSTGAVTIGNALAGAVGITSGANMTLTASSGSLTATGSQVAIDAGTGNTVAIGGTNAGAITLGRVGTVTTTMSGTVLDADYSTSANLNVTTAGGDIAILNMPGGSVGLSHDDGSSNESNLALSANSFSLSEQDATTLLSSSVSGGGGILTLSGDEGTVASDIIISAPVTEMTTAVVYTEVVDGTATPDAAGTSLIQIDGTASPVTDFLNGTAGQVLYIYASAAVTVQDTDGTLELNGDADFVMGADDTLTLLYTGAKWIELSRSNN